MLNNIATSRLQEIIGFYHSKGFKATYEKYNVKLDTINRYERELRRRESVVSAGVTEDVITDDMRKQTLISTKKFTTAEELAEFCAVDLSIWRAEKITANQWNTSAEFVSWQFKVEWRRIKEITVEHMLELFKDQVKGFEQPELPVYNTQKGDLALEVSIPDLHLGRLAWVEETGNAYDTEIAYDEWMKAHQYFIDHSAHLDVEKVVLILGNDFFNIDTTQYATNHGTSQIEDKHWLTSFEYGCKAAVDAIELWRAKGLAVEVKIICGNHDTARIHYLGAYLEAWYRAINTVSIDNSPKPRKYMVWGRNLVGWTHGKDDYRRLKSIYQSEMREYLSQTDVVEFHCGHTHVEKVVEDMGSVIIRTIPSIAQKSGWEYINGYTGNRRAQEFIWDKKRGLVDIIYYTPE